MKGSKNHDLFLKNTHKTKIPSNIRDKSIKVLFDCKEQEMK